MPTYSYKCKKCEREFDLNVPMAEYDDPQKCECGQMADRIFTMPAIHGLSSSTGVKGWGVPPPSDSKKADEKF